jgi:hypothetical protein
MLLAGAGILVGLAAIVWRLAHGQLEVPRGERGRGLWLAVGMVASVFICVLILLALGTDIFGARNLAPAWIGMPFLFGAAFLAAGRKAGSVFLVLVVAGFMVSTVRLMDPAKSSIAYKQAAGLIDDSGDRGTILDAAIVSPAPLAPLSAYLDTELPVYEMTAIQDRPDYVKELFATFDPQAILDRAFRGGGPVRVVTAIDSHAPRPAPGGRYTIDVNGQQAKTPPGWSPVSSERFEGLEPLTVTVFERNDDK